MHLKPSDATDRNKWREWLEGIRMTATVIVVVQGEYELKEPE